MTQTLAPELRLLEKAKLFATGKLDPENPKSAKLLKRLASKPDQWLECCKIFRSLSWAMEITILGLDCDEAKAVALMLERMSLSGIQLSSADGYKALALAGVNEHKNQVHEQLRSLRKEVEESTKTLLRFDKHGIVASGYKRGYPLTSYISEADHYHKLYIERVGRFQLATRALELQLRPEEELFRMALAVERNLPKIREAWETWKKEELVAKRIENIEKFSDAAGAFA